MTGTCGSQKSTLLWSWFFPSPLLSLIPTLLSFLFDTESHCAVQAGLELSVLPACLPVLFFHLYLILQIMQVVRLGGKHHYLLSHFISPSFLFFGYFVFFLKLLYPIMLILRVNNIGNVNSFVLSLTALKHKEFLCFNGNSSVFVWTLILYRVTESFINFPFTSVQSSD